MTREELMNELNEDRADALAEAVKQGKRCEIYGLGDMSTEWSIKPPFDQKQDLANMSYDDLCVAYRTAEDMRSVLKDFMQALDTLISAQHALEHASDYECDDDVVD